MINSNRDTIYLGDIDTSTITDMNYMFLGAQGFNQTLDSWDTRSVENMEVMFKHSGMQTLPKWYKKD